MRPNMHYASDKKVSVSFGKDKACGEAFVDCDIERVTHVRVKAASEDSDGES
jgi:hypothetical protein